MIGENTAGKILFGISRPHIRKNIKVMIGLVGGYVGPKKPIIFTFSGSVLN